MSGVIISSEGIHFGYNNVPTLRHLDLHILQGDLLGLIGPNGAGKSTLIKVLTGILTPQAGTIRLNGRPIVKLSPREIARSLAVVSQDDSPEFGFTVWEEVMFGRSPHHGGLHFENASDREIVQTALARTQVEHLASRRLETLSGGERQRVRIARGIAQEPQLIFLDEPTNHLDLYSQLSLMRLLREINAQGIAVFLVSHDINFVCQCCREVLLIRDGTIICRGRPSEMINPESVAGCFNIRAQVIVDPETGIPRINPLALID